MRLNAPRGHILLVEDEPVNAAVAQGYLAALGCSSVWVDNGAEAVSRSSAERFDLIMMDLNMPVMDGFETTRLIRQRQALGEHIPIVAITAHQRASYSEACAAAGMDDILSKPYTLEECARLISRFVSARPDSDDPITDKTPDADQLELAVRALLAIDRPVVTGLRKLRSNRPDDLYNKLVELFRVSSSAMISQLGVSLSTDDLQGVAALCHKLSAAAATVGAVKFAQAARAIEELSAERKLPEVRLKAVPLMAAHPRLCDALELLKIQEIA